LAGIAMKSFAMFALLLSLLAVGCGGGGGGGGGGGFTVSGRVLSASTGGAPDPAATVTIGSRSKKTDADGLFAIKASSGTTTATVSSDFPTFTFTFPPITQNTDLGDLWIGPEAVTVVGTVVDSTNQMPVSGVSIVFAGKRGTTDANGTFTLQEVAYDSAADFIFFGIIGTASKSGYLPSPFSADTPPNNGIVTIPIIQLSPQSDSNPPPPPGNLYGTVTLQGGGNSSGTVVTVFQGGVPKRQLTVGNDQKYSFWVPPADYTIHFHLNGYQDQDVLITGFTSPDQNFRNDVVLVP